MSTSDAPRPPGGPLRDDQPDGPMAPDATSETEETADRAVPQVTFGSEDESGDDEETEATQEIPQGDEARDLQEENAETSLDQPSS